MRLFIRIRPSPQPANPAADPIRCEWLLRDDRGQPVAQEISDLDGIKDVLEARAVSIADDLADPENVVVFAPSAEIAWLARTVPGRRPAQIRRALPFAVEEFLTQDVESMHLAHGSIVRGQPVRCALIDRQRMVDWLDRLRDCGLQPGHMVPDASLLPCGDVSASVLIEDGETLIRTPEHIASVETASLPDALQAVHSSFDESGDSLKLETIGGGDERLRAAIDGSGFSVRSRSLNGSALEFLASRWEARRPEVDLLQGEFAPARRGGASPRGWRSVAALVAVWAFAALAVLIGEGYVASHRADALEAESIDLYRSIYPNERRVHNAYAQMRAKLRQSDAGQGTFHLLMGQLAASTAEGSINVRSITFNQGRGELASELWLSSYAQIDALKLELEGQGLAVEIASAEERDNIVRARLRIGTSP